MKRNITGDTIMDNERMQKARSGLVISEPFFGTLSYKLDLIEDSNTKTSWTDGKKLGFNAAWAETLPMGQLEASFAHHILSCALGHHVRRNGRENKTWQDASDYVVNAELKRAGFDLPDNSLYDSQYEGMYVEQVYARLKEGEQEQDDNSGSAPGGDSQAGHPDKSNSQGAPGKGDDSTGQVLDATDEEGQAADAEARAEAEEEWKTAAAQAAQIARGAGKLPGGIERGVEQFLNSRVNWREALQRFIKSKAQDDFSWSRPNKKMLAAGFYSPERRSEKMGTLALAIDMSGSVTQSMIDQFVSEIEEVRNMMQPVSTIIMVHDTQVREMWTLSADEPVAIKAKAGGGTSFDGPAFKLEQENITPDVLVFLTDLDSSTFGPEPEYPVLWVSTFKSDAPFGEVVMME